MQKTSVMGAPSLSGEDALEEGSPILAIHSSILAWRIHGQRSLVGCSPGVSKELDMTEHLRTAHFSIWASQELLMVRNLSANAGETRDSGLIQRVGCG